MVELLVPWSSVKLLRMKSNIGLWCGKSAREAWMAKMKGVPMPVAKCLRPGLEGSRNSLDPNMAHRIRYEVLWEFERALDWLC